MEKGVRFDVSPEVALGPAFATNGKKYYFPDDVDTFSKPIEATTIPADKTGMFPAMSFFWVAYRAYNEHYPLIIKPDDIWREIAHAFAFHVNAHEKELRHHFVAHASGKEKLLIEADVSRGAPAHMWEQLVLPQFQTLIGKSLKTKDIADAFAPFSSSTPTDIAVQSVMLMNAFKSYFEFAGQPSCGIPWIELRGTAKDWADLRVRFCTLTQHMHGSDGEKWAAALGPVLDQFAAAAKGDEPTAVFWQRMIKAWKLPGGYSQVTKVNGWICALYPQLFSFVPWEQLDENSSGIDLEEFNQTRASVDVCWRTPEEETVHLQFQAGVFLGAQDPNTLALYTRADWILKQKRED
jgi:hypothetical protein